MKDTLAALGRKVLGRHAHRVGLDAPPVEHVIKPLTRLQKNLKQLRAAHVKIVFRNHGEIDRLHVENDTRRNALTKTERIMQNVSELLDE